MKQQTLPPSLEKGDKAAIIATSSGVQEFPEIIDIGVERLEDRFGLKTVVYDTARKSTEELNNNPETKAEEFMQAFEDPDIKAIIALTGGEEELRMIKHLEADRLKENPTRFYGISDNTNLHIYLQNLGIQSFYGGQVLDDLLAEDKIGEYTYKYLQKAFFEDGIGKIESSEKFTDEYFDLFNDPIEDDRKRFDSPEYEFWNFEGSVEGRLWGGSLEIIFWQLAADKYIPELQELEDRILAIETSELSPSPDELKRMLMTMGERNFLQQFSAVIVGRPMRAELFEEKSLEDKKEYHKEYKETIKDEIGRYCPDTPVVFDVDFGHTHPKVPLKIGGVTRLDPEKSQIKNQ